MRRLALILSAALLTGTAALADAGGVPRLGDDGLYHPAWEQETFKNLPDDLAEAKASGKRLLIIVEQRGCIYCKKMETEVFPDPAIDRMLTDDYFALKINMWGDTEVTDFDGKVLSEKEAVRRWGINFTPTMIFVPETVPEGKTAAQAAVIMMPGAFGKGTTRALLTYVKTDAYKDGQGFQAYLQSQAKAEKSD
ncbi:thioredoxin family protein [Acidimangrovimonas sediminis]|uniref:thioredoxin family protein n=1 Tax=Acidimangrovimonas sediminis TaxID=2056283 RepID=UPI000C8084C2|nr:thioredoxin family protein [Acidimangrovimonas sediminis]